MKFQDTRLWKSAFAARANDPHQEERDRLAASYVQFWRTACTLSAEIAKILPNLTLHDEAHFDALWERADQIAGPDYRLNPLEAYVFGGAILLHDIGHAVSAYSGGLADIKATSEWSDAVTDAEATFAASASASSSDIENLALFNTLRRLHAKRALEAGLLSHFNPVHQLDLSSDLR